MGWGEGHVIHNQFLKGGCKFWAKHVGNNRLYIHKGRVCQVHSNRERVLESFDESVNAQQPLHCQCLPILCQYIYNLSTKTNVIVSEITCSYCIHLPELHALELLAPSNFTYALLWALPTPDKFDCWVELLGIISSHRPLFLVSESKLCSKVNVKILSSLK